MSYFISIDHKVSDENMKKLNILRARLKSLCTVVVVLSVLMLVFMIVSTYMSFISSKNTDIIFLIILCCFIVISASGYVYTKLKKAFITKFKTDVVPYMLKEVSNGINYIPTGCINEDVLKNSDLNFVYDSLSGEDYMIIDRTVGNAKYVLELSEVRTSFKDEKLSIVEQKLKGSFKGIVLHAKTTCRYPGEIKILKSLNTLDKLSKMIKKDNDKILLESESFNKIFDVYASDQVAVRRILTPSNMQKIEEIVDTIKTKPEISFIGNDIYMKIEYSNFLDFYSNNKVIENDKINKDYIFLKNIVELFDTFIANVEKIVVE